MEHEQVDSGGDPAAAVGDDRLVPVTPCAANAARASASGLNPFVCASSRLAAGTLTLPGTRPERP